MSIGNRRTVTDAPVQALVGPLLGCVLVAVSIAGCGGSAPTGSAPTGNGAGTNTSTASKTAGKPTTTTPGLSAPRPKSRPSLLAFANCMRSHGVPNFPDPKPPGQSPPASGVQPAPSGGFTANPDSPAYQAASHDCSSLADATKVTASQGSRLMAALRRFAVCMRASSVPNFPDPAGSGEIGDNGAVSGVNQASPAFQDAEEKCSKSVSLPGPPGGKPLASSAGG